VLGNTLDTPGLTVAMGAPAVACDPGAAVSRPYRSGYEFERLKNRTDQSQGDDTRRAGHGLALSSQPCQNIPEGDADPSCQLLDVAQPDPTRNPQSTN
jgi:hypothetical protein